MVCSRVVSTVSVLAVAGKLLHGCLKVNSVFWNETESFVSGSFKQPNSTEFLKSSVVSLKVFSPTVTRLSLLHTAAHQNKLNWERDELEWIIDQAEITNGFLQSLRLKIHCASGHLLGIIEVCNTVKWAQNTVLIICLHFSPLSIDFHSHHAPPDSHHLPWRTSVSFRRSTVISNATMKHSLLQTMLYTFNILYLYVCVYWWWAIISI